MAAIPTAGSRLSLSAISSSVELRTYSNSASRSFLSSWFKGSSTFSLFCLILESVQNAYLDNGEGCLSVKEVHEGHVFRHARIKVRGYDLIKDDNVTISAEGYFAIALQHEIDHLSGILFYDRIDKNDPWKEDELAEVI